jgi:hypothetical protein
MKYLKSLSCFNLQEYWIRKETKIFDAKTDLNFVTAPFSECWNFSEEEETPDVVCNIPERWRTLEKPPRFYLQILYPGSANAKQHGIIQRIPIDGGWRRQYFSASKNWGKRVDIRDVLKKIQEDKNLQEFFMENWNSYDVIASYDARIINGVSRIKRRRVTESTSLEELLNQIKNGTAKDTPNVAINTQLEYARYFRKLRSAIKTGS